MLSLCLIVKPEKEEAKLLDRALVFVAKYIDEICITQAGDKPSEEVSRIIKKYKGKESFWKWNSSFADARNFNFSQATKKYIFWTDADDIVEGAENIPELIRRMEEEKIDAIVMNYLYAFDVYGNCITQHLKTRIVRKDAVKWVGKVHEDFQELRQINAFMTEDVKILHKSEEKRIKESGERNLKMAKEIYKDDPKDPRNTWLVANANRAMDNLDEAIKWYKKFIEVSNSEEEKYLAYLDIADIESRKDVKVGIDYALKALNLRPKYPNAYFVLGKLNHKIKKLEQARDFILTGLTLPLPITSIIVWNPREYDAVPLSELVVIYFELGKVQEAVSAIKLVKKIYPDDKEVDKHFSILNEELKILDKVDQVIEQLKDVNDKDKFLKIIETLPVELRSHPKICYLKNNLFIKKETSGKDLVYYCSYTEKIWNPDIARERGVGGSEEAVIQLTKRWVKAGWNVTVYNNCGKEKVYDGVTYKPFWEYNLRDAQDVTIVWRHPMPCDYEINSKVIMVDMHDVVAKEEFTEDRIKNLTKVMVKSQAHRKLYPNLPDEKIVIIPNGIDPEQFTEQVKRNPYAIINTSSPDRSLESCLDVVERLIKDYPQYPWKFIWYYGWGIFDQVHKDEPNIMAWKNKINDRFERLKTMGFAEGGGMISHSEIAKKYQEANFFLYPTQFYEISCISAMKAQLAGCIPITSDAFALNETVQFGTKIHTDCEKWEKDFNFGDTQIDKYVEAIMAGKDIDFEKMKQWVKDNYDWLKVSKQWGEAMQKI
jgi:tetratricopeptide (TPR) repeat protein